MTSYHVAPASTLDLEPILPQSRTSTPLPASERASITPISYPEPQTCSCVRTCEHSCDPAHPPSAHTHARVLCLPQYRPFLVRILEPGSDLGAYHHLLAEMRRLSRCDEAESAAFQIAGAGETESPICCSSCLAGTGGSRSQLLSTMHALLSKYALYKLDRSMLLHQMHVEPCSIVIRWS